jgi:hypothetical protein
MSGYDRADWRGVPPMSRFYLRRLYRDGRRGGLSVISARLATMSGLHAAQYAQWYEQVSELAAWKKAAGL